MGDVHFGRRYQAAPGVKHRSEHMPHGQSHSRSQQFLSPWGLYVMTDNFKRLARSTLNRLQTHNTIPPCLLQQSLYEPHWDLWGVLGHQGGVFHRSGILKKITHSSHHLCSHKTQCVPSPATSAFPQRQVLCTGDK